MNKRIILAYELRRLLFSRAHALLLVLTLGLGFSQLRGTILFGFHHTAPYSPWTFCAYIAAVAPLLLAILLLLARRDQTPWERGARHLVRATPTPEAVYRLIRCGAAACAFLIAAALAMGICLAYYWMVFDVRSLGGLIGLGGLILLPGACFVLGLLLLAGRWRSRCLLILPALALIGWALRIPPLTLFDWTGVSLLYGFHPLQPEFAIPSAFVAGRAVLALMGAGCAALSLHTGRPVSFQ